MRSWQWKTEGLQYLELCRKICILEQPFHCCVALSHADECFWFFSLMSKSGEKLKAKGKKNALNKSLQNNHVGTFRIAHKETYRVNNTCHSFPCSSLNSASLLVCVSQILLWVKSEFRKWSFSVWHITQTCLSQICFRELMKADIEGEMVWNGKTWKIFLSDVSSLLHC